MIILKSYPLKQFNTFRLNAYAKYFVRVHSTEGISELIYTIKSKLSKYCVLGGGSNIIFRSYYNGWVLKNEIMGIHLYKQDEDSVWVSVGAGEDWHGLVRYSISNNWHGLENLSLIPGSVGAAPIQNIGAYGVELKDVFDSLHAINMLTGEEVCFSKKDCEFGYRHSIFKGELSNQFLITSVNLKLSKKPDFNIEYGAIKKRLQKLNIEELNGKILSDTICEIRSGKLPDPRRVGNCGSFFKNAIIPKGKYEYLQKEFKDMPFYETSDPNFVKVPTAWLIQNCGWKGKQYKEVAVYKKHALVLINAGNAKNEHVIELSERIIDSVNEKFSIEIEREVTIY